MAFTLDDHWVWDFWLADDGDLFHMYYLHAPKSLGDPYLRHRNAAVGHATSPDLITWTDLGAVLGPGGPGDFDETATWTGSVVRGPDGTWRMFYTGSRFLGPETFANIETIGVAESADLHTWIKSPAPVIRADPTWYETLGDSSWPEEAWRDPWVFADPDGDGWHMLITARSTAGDGPDRGVVGHARSADLETWQVHAPLSRPGAGFTHIEVPQVIDADGRTFLLFSCDTPALTGPRTGTTGGIWVAAAPGATGPFPIAEAELLASDDLYAGRIVRDRDGRWVLLAFANGDGLGGFGGVLTDPIPVDFPIDGSVPVLQKTADRA